MHLNARNTTVHIPAIEVPTWVSSHDFGMEIAIVLGTLVLYDASKCMSNVIVLSGLTIRLKVLMLDKEVRFLLHYL